MSSNTYIISDVTDVENLFLRFLRKILVIPLIDEVKWSPVESLRTLTVDLMENPNIKTENLCPCVLLTVGDEQYQTLTVDLAGAYADSPQQVYDDAGHLNPTYHPTGKTAVIQGSTPVSLEIRIYGRRSCSKFSTRLLKLLTLFTSNLGGLTNASNIVGLRKTRPSVYPPSADAYTVNISFNFQFLLLEDMPEMKDTAHQFVLEIVTEASKEDVPAIEQHFIIDSGDF